MYKLLLCVRYLQTRYLAFICIVSVMLGVATLIVVNAVMSGFSTKLKDRLHGVLSDVLIDTDRTDGFEVVRTATREVTTEEIDKFQINTKSNVERVLRDYYTPHARVIESAVGTRHITRKILTPDGILHEIMSSPIGDKIVAITPAIETFAVLQFRDRGRVIAKPVRLIGIEPQTRAAVGGFSEYLYHQKDAKQPTFDLSPEAMQRHEWNVTQFGHNNRKVEEPKLPLLPGAVPPPAMDVEVGTPKPKLHGAILGYNLAHFRYKNEHGKLVEEVALSPGDDIVITTAGGEDLKPVWGSFIVTDYLKTEMSEYDQSYVYVPLEQLQHLRGMIGRVNAIQIKLKNYDKDKIAVSRELRAIFRESPEIRIGTWEEHQGPVLSAIEVERGILNLLLFMIVGVAGFSILAIFTMIVSEKFRDIGILKSLGASSRGVMSIFLGYGLLLGTVGCICGTILGITITRNINEIEAFLTRQTGTALFPRDVYYFKEIPTNLDALSVILVNLGAVSIATVFSLLPAWRAARLHPVSALRSE